MKFVAFVLALGFFSSAFAANSSVDSLLGQYQGADCKVSITQEGRFVRVRLESGTSLVLTKNSLEESISEAAQENRLSDFSSLAGPGSELRMGYLETGALNYVDLRSRSTVGGVYGGRGVDLVCGQLKRLN